MRKILKYKYCVLFLILILQLTAGAVRADRVDQVVGEILRERHIPGAAVAVIKNGRVVKIRGYGTASVEFDAPATPQTVFEIGSVSKQITATAVMLLVEDGRINPDEKISVYLKGTPEIWKDVTVRHLLTHTSGIRNYTGLSGFELARRMKAADFISELAKQPLDFETGSQYSYSNSGYSLLGYIIQEVSGKSYWDFLRERIFKPLGMNSTFDRDPRYVIARRANGYEWTGGQLTGRDHTLTDLFSAGAIVSTVEDLVKWDNSFRNDTLLKKESKTGMWTPARLNDGSVYPYGFGFRFSEIRGHKLIAHSGQTAGFGSSISRFVDDDISVIALTNLGASGMGTLVARSVAKIYIPAISLRALKVQPEPEARISEAVRRALRDLAGDKTDPELLADDLIKTLSTERTKNEMKRIGAFGEPKNIVCVGSETADGKTVYRYRAETAKRLFLWRFGFSADGKIAEMVAEEEEIIVR